MPFVERLEEKKKKESYLGISFGNLEIICLLAHKHNMVVNKTQ